MAYSLEENSKLYHSYKSSSMSNTKCRKTYASPAVTSMSIIRRKISLSSVLLSVSHHRYVR
jgi:hypothetical protein